MYITKNIKYGVVYAIKVTDKEKLLLNERVENLKVEKKFYRNLLLILNLLYK